MPDFSLRKNPQPQGQTAQPLTQHQTQPTPQHNSPMSQLTAASNTAKLETENALLREALATSAQNCEALIMKLAESQTQFHTELKEMIKEVQIVSLRMQETNNHNITELFHMVDQHHSQHNNQLSNLQNQNNQFSKNLNDVLTKMSSSLIEQVKTDTATALQEHMTVIENAVEGHIIAIDNAHTLMKTANTKVINYDKALKTRFDKKLTTQKTSINKIFEVDGLKRFFFWAGIVCSILTPIVLIVIFLV